MADLTQVQLPNGTTYDLKDNTKVAKAGDTMTGKLTFNKVNNAIAYTGTQATYDMIKFKDNPNDTYGNGVIVGGGGLTVVGGGEAADTIASQHSSGGDEELDLGSDGAVYIYSNLQSGWDSRKTYTFGTDGALTAAKFVGALQGNADTATKATQDESGNNIKATYANSFSISDHTITLKNKNGGSLGTVTVPDNDTKNTAGSTDTSSKIFLIGATSQATNPQTYSDDQVYVTDGVLRAKQLQATTGAYVNTNASGDAGGLSLYGTNAPSDYGITMRNSGTASGQLGTHGYVTGDWAGYLCFTGATNRGWIFRQAGNNVASVGGTGNAVFNGSVTVGGNAANTSGCRMEFNSTTQSMDFVFN